MTRGRAAAPDPIDIGAVNRSGELFAALAARRPVDPVDDPAVRFLAALVADVDMGAPPLPTPPRLSYAKAGSRRRVVRAVVTLGVTAAVLTTAGAAAAGGGADGGKDAAGARAPHVKLSERSNGSLQVNTPGRSLGRGSASPEDPRALGRHRDDEAHPPHRSGADNDKRRGGHHDRVDDESGPAIELQEDGDLPEEEASPTSVPSPSATVPAPQVHP